MSRWVRPHRIVAAMFLAGGLLEGGPLSVGANEASATPACFLPSYGVTPAEDEEPDEDAAGFSLPGGGCAQITGYVQAGQQRNRTSPLFGSTLSGLAIGQTASSTAPSSLSAGITATTAQIEQGLFVGTTVSGSIGDTSGSNSGDGRFVFSEASFRIERVLLGYASSRFNFWDIGDFWSGATYPSRAVPLLAIDLWKAEGLTVTFSIERPEVTQASSSPVSVPTASATSQRPTSASDLVAAVTHEGETWTLFAAGAVRHRTQSPNGEAGLAATIGASFEGPIFDATHRFSTQASIASNLPSYLGTSFDRRTLSTLLGGDTTANGYSIVASVGRDLTEQVSINAYASILDLEVPTGLQAGPARVISTRAAANIIYSPQDKLRIGLEYGVGRLDLRLPTGGRFPNLPVSITLSPTGQTRVDASSATVWVSWSF